VSGQLTALIAEYLLAVGILAPASGLAGSPVATRIVATPNALTRRSKTRTINYDSDMGETVRVAWRGAPLRRKWRAVGGKPGLRNSADGPTIFGCSL
jgi:hypothetical protein